MVVVTQSKLILRLFPNKQITKPSIWLEYFFRESENVRLTCRITLCIFIINVYSDIIFSLFSSHAVVYVEEHRSPLFSVEAET